MCRNQCRTWQRNVEMRTKPRTMTNTMKWQTNKNGTNCSGGMYSLSFRTWKSAFGSYLTSATFTRSIYFHCIKLYNFVSAGAAAGAAAGDSVVARLCVYVYLLCFVWPGRRATATMLLRSLLIFFFFLLRTRRCVHILLVIGQEWA